MVPRLVALLPSPPVFADAGRARGSHLDSAKRRLGLAFPFVRGRRRRPLPPPPLRHRQHIRHFGSLRSNVSGVLAPSDISAKKHAGEEKVLQKRSLQLAFFVLFVSF